MAVAGTVLLLSACTDASDSASETSALDDQTPTTTSSSAPSTTGDPMATSDETPVHSSLAEKAGFVDLIVEGTVLDSEAIYTSFTEHDGEILPSGESEWLDLRIEQVIAGTPPPGEVIKVAWASGDPAQQPLLPGEHLVLLLVPFNGTSEAGELVVEGWVPLAGNEAVVDVVADRGVSRGPYPEGDLAEMVAEISAGYAAGHDDG
ncbi:MAG: hypothetical protein JJLCMIEE_03371 [Acidimicrobiales bacterium]|nr:MAG: hypothetical protein EDR02_12205 [Actinomycetota bacterium]MBV6510240.1 hypothetical protein [Acidimicrobiales bacterium]RIK04206.1 MAG: hypothetical protein DCC48_14020 [Acidobacteriota bacterium]